MTACTCTAYRLAQNLGPDLEAERVATLIPTMGQWLASLTVYAPHLLPGRVSVSERLRARLRAVGESGAARPGLVWACCVLGVVAVLGGWLR